MKAPSWFKPEINANFILTLILLVATGSGLYFGLQASLEKQELRVALAIESQRKVDEEQTKNIERGQTERRADMLRLEAQVRTIEQKADLKLEALQRDLSELKGTTREINANLQWIVRQQGGSPTFTIPPR